MAYVLPHDCHQKSKSGNVYRAPCYRNENPVAGSYLVKKPSEDHTLEQHLPFLGREMDVNCVDLFRIYVASFTSELLNLVRSDPRADFVKDDTTGEEELLDRFY